MVASFHFSAEKTTVRVDGTLNRHSEVVSLFLHGVSPVDSEFSDSRFIDKNSSAEKVGDKLGGSVWLVFLWKVLWEDVVDVVADSDKLLGPVANGNDKGRDT